MKCNEYKIHFIVYRVAYRVASFAAPAAPLTPLRSVIANIVCDGSRFGYVSVMFRLCFGYVSVMLRLCFGYVSVMLRLCFGYASVMLRLCFGYVSVMFRLCFGYASVMLRLCFGYASVMLRLCDRLRARVMSPHTTSLVIPQSLASSL